MSQRIYMLNGIIILLNSGLILLGYKVVEDLVG